MNLEISNDLRLELLQALAARKNTPQDVKDLTTIGRPKGAKSPGSGIPKGVRVYDCDRQLIGEWDSSALAGEAMNAPFHRIKVACQTNKRFFNNDRNYFFAEYFELPKKPATR